MIINFINKFSTDVNILDFGPVCFGEGFYVFDSIVPENYFNKSWELNSGQHFNGGYLISIKGYFLQVWKSYVSYFCNYFRVVVFAFI